MNSENIFGNLTWHQDVSNRGNQDSAAKYSPSDLRIKSL